MSSGAIWPSYSRELVVPWKPCDGLVASNFFCLQPGMFAAQQVFGLSPMRPSSHDPLNLARSQRRSMRRAGGRCCKTRRIMVRDGARPLRCHSVLGALVPQWRRCMFSIYLDGGQEGFGVLPTGEDCWGSTYLVVLAGSMSYRMDCNRKCSGWR